jgi:DNA-damage-inducible protein J
MATITTRIDDETKRDLTRFSDEIGISVGSLFNAWARNLLRTREVTFKLDDERLEDQEMYANADKLREKFQKSVDSGRSSLVI